ncbi:unnamed protein product [Gongylonema pulchrum]|uniref:VOC family protein n=1 Tax=Gongylonema pulchrum TaxID=637853 RepID=A0A183E8Z0_9BILA|nr:unnamed protein product [Gongylonema pulchrum]
MHYFEQVETAFQVYASLFAYALTAYDARWLFRLAARPVDSSEFALLFGGGGEKKQKAALERPPGILSFGLDVNLFPH